jgi:hypothetical protein
MKQLYILLFCCISFGSATAQTDATINSSVEKSIFGVQTGFLGIWAYNELKLTNSIALRSELGFDSGIFGGTYYDNDVNFLLYPTINLEPRFYYNLNKRIRKNRSIENNSGNFLALKFNYTPDWFTITNYDYDISVAESYAIILKWGIKRTIGKHFTYEAGLGFGYRTFFLKQYNYQSNKSEAALDLHLRIGYTF